MIFKGIFSFIQHLDSTIASIEISKIQTQKKYC